MKLSIILLLLGFVDWSVQAVQPPRVSTLLGPVVGEVRRSSLLLKYEAYEGIPYARPPVKTLRFRPPKSARRWQQELDATQKSSVCMQYRSTEDGYKVVGDEDCLYLNVYARQQLITKPTLPVMVWIPGGAFQYSSGNEVSETRLMNRNIVLVTINYRLGPFGFLSTGDRIVPGNMGLKDQRMALRWVSDNIGFFGGDPRSVTIFGVDAGAASVHYHYMSPLSAGLFHRGISISGVALDPWPQTKRAPEKAKQLGALLDCPTSSSDKLVECLRDRPARNISETVAHFLGWLSNPIAPFGPVVERQKCPRPFINASPIEIMNRGDLLDVPWISGVVTEEGLFPGAEFVANDVLLEQLNDNWLYIAPYLLNYNDTVPLNQQNKVAELVREHYLQSKQISSDNVEPLIRMIGDRLFAVNFEKAAKLQAKVNKSPVWTYYYSYRAARSVSESISQSTKDFGVCHGDDVALVLDPVLSNTKKLLDTMMQNNLIDLYTSFAIKGTPKVGLSKWTQLDASSEKFSYLRIGRKGLLPLDTRMDSSNNFAESSFWSTIDFDEN
ncbi:venom carboxylesterase-6 [Lasioglossum baleicum]|uniref:venom carboxylesterase-6 n=1 Tax=Lasioglossum baleicum TaxID=434251 RepID=UPI003FCEE0A3